MARYMVKITRREAPESVRYYGPYDTKAVAKKKLKEHMGIYKIPGRSARVVLASSVSTTKKRR